MNLLKFHNKTKGYTQSRQPGVEADIEPKPIAELEEYKAARKLENKATLVTGGDSSIGRAIAILYAEEGANVTIGYYDEHQDAEGTANRLQEMGVKARAYAHDLKNEKRSQKLIKGVINGFGSLNILVNNGGVQFPRDHFEGTTPQQVKETFMINIFGTMSLSQTTIPYLFEEDTIINTTNVAAYRGSGHLIGYSATKDVIVPFIRSLATTLMEKGIHVNAAVSDPIHSPLIPAISDKEKVEHQGDETPTGRHERSTELASSYVFLATHVDSSYITGQVIHVNGGDFITS